MRLNCLEYNMNIKVYKVKHIILNMFSVVHYINYHFQVQCTQYKKNHLCFNDSSEY